MIVIAHRANLSGKHTAKYGENHPDSIKFARDEGFDVEIDLWYKEQQCYLGHDKPEFKIDEPFLYRSGLWIHAKDLATIAFLVEHHSSLCYFFHNTDDCTLTSDGWIWTFPRKPVYTKKSVVILTDNCNDPKFVEPAEAVCTDFPTLWE